jgi:hypothetical protein
LVERYKSPPKVGLGENRVTMRAITEDVDDSFLSLSEGSRRSRRVLPEMQSSPTSNFAQNLGSHSDGALAKGVIGDGVGSYQPTYQRMKFLDDVPGANYD